MNTETRYIQRDQHPANRQVVQAEELDARNITLCGKLSGDTATIYVRPGNILVRSIFTWFSRGEVLTKAGG
jgi:hypothetical protein